MFGSRLDAVRLPSIALLKPAMSTLSDVVNTFVADWNSAFANSSDSISSTSDTTPRTPVRSASLLGLGFERTRFICTIVRLILAHAASSDNPLEAQAELANRIDAARRVDPNLRMALEFNLRPELGHRH